MLKYIKLFLWSLVNLSLENILWWIIVLWEWMLRHHKTQEFLNPPNFDWQLIRITKNTQVLNFSNSHVWPTPFPLLSNAPLLSPFIHWSLSLSPSTPHSCSPVMISHKYSADLMRQYHCNKLIESKRLFHLGIAHNNFWWSLKFKDEAKIKPLHRDTIGALL